MNKDRKEPTNDKKNPLWLAVLALVVVPIVVALIGNWNAAEDESPSTESSEASTGEAIDDGPEPSEPAEPESLLPPYDTTLREPEGAKASWQDRLVQLPLHARVWRAVLKDPQRTLTFDGNGPGQFLVVTAVDRTRRAVADDLRLVRLGQGEEVSESASRYLPPSTKVFVLPADGRYRLQLRPDAKEAGQVLIRATVPEDVPDRVVRGDTRITGTLVEKSEVDLYSIAGTREQRILVVARVVEPVGRIGTEVFGAHGLVGAMEPTLGSRFQIPAWKADRLTLVVFGEDHEEPLPYEIYIKRLDATVALEEGRTESGALSFLGDSKEYTFAAEKGDHWTIDLECDPGFVAKFSVVGPDHQPKQAICAESSPARMDVRPKKESEAGMHRIRIKGINATTGGFRLIVQRLEGGQS